MQSGIASCAVISSCPSRYQLLLLTCKAFESGLSLTHASSTVASIWVFTFNLLHCQIKHITNIYKQSENNITNHTQVNIQRVGDFCCQTKVGDNGHHTTLSLPDENVLYTDTTQHNRACQHAVTGEGLWLVMLSFTGVQSHTHIPPAASARQTLHTSTSAYTPTHVSCQSLASTCRPAPSPRLSV